MIGTRSGFTMLELLAVMVIITILVGLGAKGYSLARRQAKESRAKAELETLRTALNEYRVEYGRYPAQASPMGFKDLAEIAELTNAVEGASLLDPWGNAYQYQSTNRFLYRIWSEGQDAELDSDNIDPSLLGY